MSRWYEGYMRLRDRRRRRVKAKQRSASRAWRRIARRMGDIDPVLFAHRARWRAIESARDRQPVTFRVEGYYGLVFEGPYYHGGTGHVVKVGDAP